MAKTIKNPRISINKLAEYLEANSTRRKQIIYDAKYPQDIKGVRYIAAKEVMCTYLTDHRDKIQLKAAIEKFSKKKATTTWQIQDRDLSVEMLNTLLTVDLSSLKDCDLFLFDEENKLLTVKGVAISIYPDIIVKSSKKGITQKGVIKLHTSKTYPLNDESKKIVAGMLFTYVSAHLLKTGEVANSKLCISCDLITGSISSAPGSFASRFKRIEAACEEIALRWPTL
jgi:hypothetical protein